LESEICKLSELCNPLESEICNLKLSELCNPLGSEDLKFAIWNKIWNLKFEICNLKFEIGNWNLQFPSRTASSGILNHYEPSSQ